MKHLKKKESAGHDVTILQHIPADQLQALKTTYEFMLEAINDAIRNKRTAEKKTAQIIALKDHNLNRYDRRCMKVAAMIRRDYSPSEISIRFDCDIGGKTAIRNMAARGRALLKARMVEARRRYIIRAHIAGVGLRESARNMPPALGSCSCSYACKIIKAYKLRQQPPLNFPLTAV